MYLLESSFCYQCIDQDNHAMTSLGYY